MRYGVDDRGLIGRENGAMACAIVVRPNEEKETTLKRWAEIYDFLKRDKALTEGKGELFRSYEQSKKQKFKTEIEKTRDGQAEAIRLARRKMYNSTDVFLSYLFNSWDMAFETYQVLEFIFRASIESHQRDLFDYTENHYADELRQLKGTPQQRYQDILRLVRGFSKTSFFGIDDLRPTKMDFVRDLNAELYGHVELLKKIHREISQAKSNPALESLSKDLGKSMRELESWAYGRILGSEARGKFLSFRDGQVIMDAKNFIYFKVYILVFMGVYGEFTNRVRERGQLYKLASEKLKFESGKHFDFKMNSTFLLGRERYAEEERDVESIPSDRGFLDEELLSYIVERNEALLERSGELPFYLLDDLDKKRTA